MQKKSSKSSSKAKAIIGAGVAASLVGAYFLYGSKNAKRNRQKVKSWTLKAKGEVLERLEGLKDVSEDVYNATVDTVTKKYSLIKSIDKKEVESLARTLKSLWKDFAKKPSTPTKKRSSVKKAKKG